VKVKCIFFPQAFGCTYPYTHAHNLSLSLLHFLTLQVNDLLRWKYKFGIHRENPA